MSSRLLDLLNNKTTPEKIAIGLFSGGLDSWLAALLLKNQGFDLYLIHFVCPFFGYPNDQLEQLKTKVKQLDMNLVIHKMDSQYINEVLQNPVYGYGKSANACIDCHAYMFRTAKQYMYKYNAALVFSGEVIGQRPMSQNKHALRAVEKTSGIKGFLLRPLSAKLLKKTIPETEGIVNRDLLMDFSGRGRTRQIKLAEDLGLTDYPDPAGGCKFTDINFRDRLISVYSKKLEPDWDDLELLLYGRFFELGENDNSEAEYYIIIPRDVQEVQKLSLFMHKGIQVKVRDYPGPTALILHYKKAVLDSIDENSIVAQKARDLVIRYSKAYQLGIKDVTVDFVRNA